MSLPTVSRYGNYSGDNYGVHCKRVDMLGVTLWYSYQTIVAYRDDTDGRVVSENVWGPTTGKHLNWIDGGSKSTRLARQEFVTKLKAMLERHEVK